MTRFRFRAWRNGTMYPSINEDLLDSVEHPETVDDLDSAIAVECPCFVYQGL